MDIDITAPDKFIIEEIAGTVRKGGVILYPTDTVYGLGCDPFNADALDRIFLLKGRDSAKGVLLLVPGKEWISRVAIGVDPGKLSLCDPWWPGPVTCLFMARPDMPALLKGAEGKIGIRFPDNRFLLDCMNRIPGPLVSTSANRSGGRASGDFAELDQSLVDKVDLAIRNTGPAEADLKPSTVVDLSGDRPAIVRAGEGIELVKASGIQ